MQNSVYQWYVAVLDLLFPPKCIICGSKNGWFCEKCLNAIPLTPQSVCEKCGNILATEQACHQCQIYPLNHIDGIYSFTSFEEHLIRPAIHGLKYKGYKVLAGPLGQLLIKAYKRYDITADVIIPVPLHPSRFKERGYNQSTALAKELSRILGIPLNTQILSRTRKTNVQARLTGQERRQNVHQAFVCHNRHAAVQGITVLLIDDVCTTGFTMDACAAALKAGGAMSVWGLTVAKAHYTHP